MTASGATPPETFTTERLFIRRPSSNDANALFDRWATDQEVTKYLTWRPHGSVEESMAHIERCSVGWERATEFTWFLEARDTGRLLGSVASRRSGHRVNIGYLLAKDAWGQGYMTEALEPIILWWMAQPGVFRIWATCDVDNNASARVLEKSGFQFEGVLRRWELHPNISAEARDALCFSRVRE